MIHPEHVIGYKRSITSLKGIIAQGEEVLPKFLNGGEASFKRLIESGHIVKWVEYKTQLSHLGIEDPAGSEPAAGAPQPSLKAKQAEEKAKSEPAPKRK